MAQVVPTEVRVLEQHADRGGYQIGERNAFSRKGLEGAFDAELQQMARAPDRHRAGDTGKASRRVERRRQHHAMPAMAPSLVMLL